MARYVALLRGINVGGKNLIPMTALTGCFEEHGFEEVRTYIQSGNVVFSIGTSSQAELTRRIERMLAAAFEYERASCCGAEPRCGPSSSGHPRGSAPIRLATATT
jgi:uncharacterized protein (DUF1697 family)